jgi:hypothetical protein
MSSFVSNNVCQLQGVIAAWNKVQVEGLLKAIGDHHQSCIALYSAEKDLQSVQLSIWDRIVLNRAEYENRMAQENLLKLLVEACTKKVEGDYLPIRDSLKKLAKSVLNAHGITWSWIRSIQNQLVSEIEKTVTTTAITVTDMTSLLQSLEIILEESNEAKSLLQKAKESWVQQAQNRLLSTGETSTHSATTERTLSTIKDMFQFLQVCEKVAERSYHAAWIFREIDGYWMFSDNVHRYIHKTRITDHTTKPEYYVSMIYGFPHFSLIKDISPMFTGIITAAEEVAKSFPPSSGKPDTQTA